jgi:hypothetical protein
MTVKIACPVCDRPGVVENICPNCETDLTLIRGLMDLPVAPSPQSSVITKSSSVPSWLLLTAIAFLTLGIVLGGVGVYWPTQNTVSQLQNKVSQLQDKIAQTEAIQATTKHSSIQTCNQGFEYVVRRGDSLSLLAMRFYGNAEQQTLIVQKNPSLEGREDFLEIGDKLLIPNPNSECL